MDTLAVCLSSMVRRVETVRCVRRVDVGRRRQPLQAKVGATMTPECFRNLAREEKVGHKGLAESVAMIAAGLGHRTAPGSVQVAIEPELADRPINSALGRIESGHVAGAHHTAQWSGDGLRIVLNLTMAVGLEDPVDEIVIEGPVPLQVKIAGSVPGDSATVAMVLNYARILPMAKPGLLSMLDLPPAGCRR